MDAHRAEIMPLFARTYGPENATKWWAYWRVFYMSCAELWGYRAGEEWLVGHYLFRKPRALPVADNCYSLQHRRSPACRTRVQSPFADDTARL